MKRLKAILAHPAALVMLLYAFIICLCADSARSELDRPTFVAPICIVASLALESLLGKKRLWSLAVLPLFFAAAFIPALDKWPDSLSFGIITLVVLPLVLLLYRRTTDNESFIRHTVWTTWSAMLSLAVAGLTALLMAGIFYSVDTLFGTDMMDSLEHLIVGFPFIMVAPILFISISETEEITSIRKVLEAITNWVISPALVIYSAVLAVYLLKILFSWTLPCGGVAVMCFIWGIAAFYVNSVQPLFEKHPFAWFRAVYRWLSIPFVILLWISIIRRITEYGITPSRYYLILCGVLMTIFIIISFVRGRKLYYSVTAAAAVLFLASAIIPGVNYKSVTIASQLNQVKKCAAQLDILSEEGRFIEVPDGTVLDGGMMDRLTDAMRVVRGLDDKALEQFGELSYDNARVSYSDDEDITVSWPDEEMTWSVEGFRTLSIPDEYVTPDSCANYQKLFESKLAAIGAPDTITADFVREHSSDLLVWDIDSTRLILSSIGVTGFSTDSLPQIYSIRIHAILKK